ncbi:MAG: DUF1501 domain-containing protein, partial [Pirellulaceae bacterium]
MLTINGSRRTVCSGISRREMLQVGGAGLFGLNMATLMAAEESGLRIGNGRAKSVMFLFLFGGPSQLE